MAFFFDADIFGHRRRRALVGGAATAAIILRAWVSLLWFLGLRNINRSRKPWEVDIRSGRDFADPLAVLMFLGFSFATFQVYGQWLYGTLTNRPRTLDKPGLVESMRSVGIDSHNTPFLTEAGTYFACWASALWLRGSKLPYGVNAAPGTPDLIIISSMKDDTTLVH